MGGRCLSILYKCFVWGKVKVGVLEGEKFGNFRERLARICHLRVLSLELIDILSG